MPLMSAQIHFIDCRLSLIHIPLSLYPYFLQPILQLLFSPDDGRPGDDGAEPVSWTARHPFLNISVTPIECSVVCSKEDARDLFEPIIAALGGAAREGVSITTEDYVVVQVDGEGLDAGQRVLELTSPLALAGISIFFITTYFSDYILVPSKSQGQVVGALERRGFVFERHADAFVGQSHHQRSTSSGSVGVPPQSPPPTNVGELQKRTSALLERRNVFPQVDRDVRLVQCAGRKEGSSGSSLSSSSAAQGANEARLHLGLVKCLVGQPRFLSLTLTDTEPASLLLEERLLGRFGPDEVLLGSKEDILVPITLDLRGLPLESTGIVCGVAGRLVGTGEGEGAAMEMSYLSTAMAGTVMVGEHELARAIAALRGGQNGAS
ncbi:MAG: hypothetical protein M1832_002861 [Thelocarpon impressellum]|nr:MAG: hypothetical protein M1832_002861 [Thelocarpon impressellum]